MTIDTWSDRVAAACRLLETPNGDGVPSLADVARRVGAKPGALRRAFVRTLGVTPRQYGDARRRERLRDALREGTPVTTALFDAGYGSTSRLYENAHGHLGMTPASYRAGGEGASITYTVVSCDLGALVVATTERGVCLVELRDTDSDVDARVRSEFPNADVGRDDDALGSVVAEVLRRIEGQPAARDIPIDVHGTAFQRRVWEALRAIPLGEVRTYGEVAAAIGSPAAVRAVGGACGANPVPIVVPCHRVVPAAGGTGNYGLGKERKAELLRREGAKVRPAPMRA